MKFAETLFGAAQTALVNLLHDGRQGLTQQARIRFGHDQGQGHQAAHPQPVERQITAVRETSKAHGHAAVHFEFEQRVTIKLVIGDAGNHAGQGEKARSQRHQARLSLHRALQLPQAAGSAKGHSPAIQDDGDE